MSGYDALTHLDAPDLASCLDEVVVGAHAVGVTGWLVAAGDPARWQAVREAASRTGGDLALGGHPWWTGEPDAPPAEAWCERLDGADPPIVGEIGLDHHHARSMEERARQRSAFRAQLAWARERDRPVVLHGVRAIPEILHLLRQDGLPKPGGILHGFNGGPDLALDAVAVGLHLGIGPGLLRPSGHRIREAVCRVPLRHIVLETDCPDQAFPEAGLPTPALVPVLARRLAELRVNDPQIVLEHTGRNARGVLRTHDKDLHRG